MGMKNHDNVVIVLDRLVANGVITQGEANQILKTWEEQHPNWQSPPPAASTKTRAA